MKRVFLLFCCIVLISFSTAIIVYADDTEAMEPTGTGIVTEEIVTESIVQDEPESSPTADTKAESKVTTADDETITGVITAYIKENFEEISVIVSLLLMTIYEVRKHIVLNKSIGVLNNNAIVVAESSKESMSSALDEIKSVGTVVSGYKDEILGLLAEVRKNAEESKRLEEALDNANKYLVAAKQANIEFSNELAELLVLANIPNAKKDELYSRHRAAVESITDIIEEKINEVD